MKITKRHEKKGVAAPIGSTLLVLLAAMTVIVVGTLAFIAVQVQGFFGGGPSVYWIEFVPQNNKAFLFGTVLASAHMGDRAFLEHASEISATSLKKARSDNLGAFVADFAGLYTKEDKRVIYVNIKNGDETLFTFDNQVSKCGDTLQGFCVDGITCGLGRKQISGNEYNDNFCSVNLLCCTEDLTNGKYKPTVARCGTLVNGEKPGVCDVAPLGTCRPGRINYPDPDSDCQSVRPGGMTCCIATSELNALKGSGLTSFAEIPVFYKDTTGVVEVTVI